MNKTKRKKVWDKTGGRCYYCGIEMCYGGTLENKRTFCVDHIVPRKYGNETHELENLVPCCKSCNSIKNRNDLETFRKRLAYRKSNLPQLSGFDLMILRKEGFKLPEFDRYTFYFEKISG